MITKKRLEDLTDQELLRLMADCRAAIQYQFSQRLIGRPHYALIVFNEPAAVQYTASCERDEAAKALRETVKRLEKR